MGMIDQATPKGPAATPTTPSTPSTPPQAVPPQAAAPNAGGADLKAIEQQIDQQVPPQMKDEYLRIVVAGMKLMGSAQTQGDVMAYIQTITGPEDVPRKVAHGVMKALQLIFNASKGKMSIGASPPAAIVLMTHALAMVQAVKKIPMTPDLVAQTTKLVAQGIFELYKIPKEMIVQAIQRNQQGGKPGAPPPTPPTAPPPTPPAAPPAAMPAQGGV